MALVGAVETGGTLIRCAWGSGPGEHEAYEEFPTASPEEALRRIVAFFARAGGIERVGVAAFGPLELDPASPDWGRLLPTPKPGWAGFALAPALADALSVPVMLETDVNAAALAEARWGAGQGADPVAYLTVGTGIGLGVVAGGRALHGILHPEAGHLVLRRDPHDPFAGVCPFHGDCWEGLASGPSVAARWRTDPAQLPDDHPAWTLEAGYVTAGLASIVLILAPQVVVLGGGIGRRAGLRRAVAERLPQALAGVLDRVPAVVAPRFGAHSGLAGAFALALDEGLEDESRC